MASSSEELARFSRGFTLSDAPDDIIDKVKAHLLDQLGAALVGANVPWVRPVRQYALAVGSRGRSRLIGTAHKLEAEAAALVNGTVGNSAGIDDFHVRTWHAGCVVVPSCLALAEDLGASGQDVLRAAIIGFESASRVADATMSANARGFHSTNVYGVYGAAAGAAILLGLGEGQFMDALSIAGGHASGLGGAACLAQGRLHGGMAAANGIRSARLAQAGLAGSPAVFEGPRGFLHTFSEDPKPERLTKGLGRQWALEGNRIRLHPCPPNLCAPVEALLEILSEENVAPGDIKEIHVGVDQSVFSMASAMEGRDPADGVCAPYNPAYTLAIAAQHGALEVTTYLEALSQGFRDPILLKMSERVKLYLDPECEAVYPERWLAKVTLITEDGSKYSAQRLGKANVARPVVEDKIRNLVQHVLPTDNIEGLIEGVDRLEHLSEISELTHLLEVMEP